MRQFNESKTIELVGTGQAQYSNISGASTSIKADQS